MLKTTPAVFAVSDEYQIMVEVKCEALFSVKVNGNVYYDETNGIMNSLSNHHRVSVPMNELNPAGEYTVCIRPVIERKPYFTKTADEVTFTYKFRPVPTRGARAFHISDAHNRIKEPVAAAKAFGSIDFLILNGDVIDHSGDISKFANVYEICAELTSGEIPVVFSRGNHDMRGRYAESFAKFTPSHLGNTYYTFRLGSIWGILLDCGEDKDDSHKEYGLTVACHQFRKRQTEFLKRVIRDADSEYNAEGVMTKLIISHKPFSEVTEPPFDIEQDIYGEWLSLLREYVKPDLMICGHTHHMEIRQKGHERDSLGQPCPVVISSQPGENYFAGTGFTFGDKSVMAVFTDNTDGVIAEHEIIY